MNKPIISCVLLLLVLLFNTPFLEASPQDRVLFSVVPMHAPEKLWQLYNPLVEYLNKNTPIKWELRLYKNHKALEQGICNGEVNIVLSGPFLAYRVYKRCGAMPILLALNDEGMVSMKILLITMDPEVKTIADLRGKRIGLFKPVTAAYIITKTMLEKEGINEQNTQFIIFQGLDRLTEAILAGTVSAIGVRDNALGALKGYKYRELKVSEPIPGFVFLGSPNAPETAKSAFIKSLLRLNPKGNKDHRILMKRWDEAIKYGFTLPNDEYLELLERNNRLYGGFIK